MWLLTIRWDNLNPTIHLHMTEAKIRKRNKTEWNGNVCAFTIVGLFYIFFFHLLLLRQNMANMFVCVCVMYEVLSINK